MDNRELRLADVLLHFPPEWPEDPLPGIQQYLERSPGKLVVIDDDPTGSQTVHGIPILTEWTVGSLRAELENDLPAFYLLTNSRAVSPDLAEAINKEIGQNLREASRLAGRKVVPVSRGDSTLRGHFPEEVQALCEGFGVDFDAWLLIPALFEEGRYTFNDIHYVEDGDKLIPAGDTAYARDATFGFKSSDLRKWVEEKTSGRVPADRVCSITIMDVRSGGPDRVREKLLQLEHGSICIVNAISRRDLEVFTLGLLAAEADGRKYLYRTGPSFVPVRIGLPPYPLLSCRQLPCGQGVGGLIIVGSYVPNTTRQVEVVQSRGLVTSIEVEVERLLDPKQHEDEIRRVAENASQEIQTGRNALVYTSRRVMTSETAEQSLAIVRQVSASLVAILHRISVRPRYILAKGGITSSDIATQGLGVRRAIVAGQLAKGVSVWILGPESRYDGLMYIVFPGNVGEPDTLAEVVEILQTGPGGMNNAG